MIGIYPIRNIIIRTMSKVKIDGKIRDRILERRRKIDRRKNIFITIITFWLRNTSRMLRIPKRNTRLRGI